MVEATFSAYFEQGRDVTYAQVLIDIAAGNGIDHAQAAAYLASDAGAQEVRADQAMVRAKGGAAFR